jgi:hypothetical protein
MKKIKRYITHYLQLTNKGTEKWEGISILAFSFKEAQDKINLHNSFLKKCKLILDGEYIETIY